MHNAIVLIPCVIICMCRISILSLGCQEMQANLKLKVVRRIIIILNCFITFITCLFSAFLFWFVFQVHLLLWPVKIIEA